MSSVSIVCVLFVDIVKSYVVCIIVFMELGVWEYVNLRLVILNIIFLVVIIIYCGIC